MNIAASSGTFTSPNYPSNYGNHENCLWRITVPAGFAVSLTFNDFELENSSNCRYDYVKVEESGSGSLIGSFCGTRTQFAVTSSGRSLYVRFRSDNNVRRRGFNASFIAVSRPPPGKTFVAFFKVDDIAES